MSTITKVMQYEIIKPLSCDWNLFGEVLRKVQHESFRIKNRVIQLYYQHENARFAHKQLHGTYPDDKEVYGIPFSTYVYRVIAPEFQFTITNNLTSAIQKATKAWKANRLEVLKGNKSIPSFRRTNPIELYNKAIRNIKFTDNRKVDLDVSLLSQKGAKELNASTTFRVLVHPGKNGAKEIMERIISGEYKLCSNMIVQNERKKKWMLVLTYQFDAQEKNWIKIVYWG